MSDVETRPDGAETDETPVSNTDTAETAENASEAQTGGNTDETTGDADTFPREYVEQLRKESASYRERAKTAEDKAETIAKRLHAALVEATGRLENPAELAFDAEHLDDAEKLTAAIDALVEAKPYMAKRKVAGDAGQGPRGDGEPNVNLLALLRGER